MLITKMMVTNFDFIIIIIINKTNFNQTKSQNLLNLVKIKITIIIVINFTGFTTTIVIKFINHYYNYFMLK